MKQNSYSPKQIRYLRQVSRSSVPVGSPQTESTFSPSADEVARKVGLGFMHQALQPWREVQRWLAAEAELIAEHEFVPVRVRSIHHHNY